MEEKPNKMHKKSKKNEVSDAGICEAEQGGNNVVIEGCKSSEKDMGERKSDEGRDYKKKKQKKKKVREYSNEGTVEIEKVNEKEVGVFASVEDNDGNVTKKVERKRKKREKDETTGGSGHNLQEIDFEDAKGNGLSTLNEACANVIQHPKEVETADRGLDRNLVENIGKKKRKREKNKDGVDESASQQDSTKLTGSGKRDRENQNGKYFEEFDEGCARKIIKKAEKKNRKKEKGKEMDGSAAVKAGIQSKENNQSRVDPTMNEAGDNNVKNGNTKGKRKKAKAEKNGSQDSKPEKSPKKVRFSSNIEVFPPSDVVGNGTGKKEDTLVRGKRFSKEEDEIVKRAVYAYIEENCLGDEGLNMVLNCRSHPKVRNCWKEIGTAIPYRPYTAVYYRAQVLFRRSENRKWTDEEYEMVRKFHEQHGTQWKVLADELGKHRWHVKDAWRRIKIVNKKKGCWSQEEYQTLFELVNMDLRMKFSEEKKSKYGMLRDNICWKAISEILSTRTDATCCLKWYNQLTSPMVAEGKWADADDYRLINALYQLDASCIEDVNWDNLLDHRSGDICRKRWNQMVLHIGQHGTKSFAEQVEVLANRYCPDLLEAREAWDTKPLVS